MHGRRRRRGRRSGTTAATARSGDGDGSSATRVPQPASSVAAPAAASTLARHLSLTSASSMLPVYFVTPVCFPPSSRPSRERRPASRQVARAPTATTRV